MTPRLPTLALAGEALRAEARMGGLCAIHGCGPLTVAATGADADHNLSGACPVVITISVPD